MDFLWQWFKEDSKRLHAYHLVVDRHKRDNMPSCLVME